MKFSAPSIDLEERILLRHIGEKAYLLEDEASLDPLVEAIGNARVVLLGEASHGTHEYYAWRAKISQRLIREKGFSFVAVEGDWPDCYRLNRYVKGYRESGESAKEVLAAFNRWPTWMWANWEIVAFAEWLRQHNSFRTPPHRIGFYGLDVYSLWESLEAILKYLQANDPDSFHTAKQAMQCFEPYWDEEGQSYARATYLVPASCREEVTDLLMTIRHRMPEYDGDAEAAFNAEQNAIVVVNAEKYYLKMVRGGRDSWNLRDQHMHETLNRLLDFHGKDSKGIVWEHNTHVGDARATDMGGEGMINIGQLVREERAPSDVFIAGFGSYRGTIIAGKGWGEEMERMEIPPARSDSFEAFLHGIHHKDVMLLLRDFQNDNAFLSPFDHRAIGVVYNPNYERFGNYVPSLIPARYDAFLYCDETTALHPLHITPDGGQMPETYPWGV